jgi:hypothetical protein
MNQIDDQATDRRADKKSELMRHSHQSLGLALGSCRHRSKRQGTAGRLNHRAANSLDKAKQD